MGFAGDPGEEGRKLEVEKGIENAKRYGKMRDRRTF